MVGALLAGSTGTAGAARPGPASIRGSLAALAPRAAAPGADALAASERQIAALVAEKRARTGATAALVGELRTRAAAAELAARTRPADRLGDDAVEVDLKATVDGALDTGLAALGVTVTGRYPQYGAVRARVPARQLRAVAGLPGVRSVRPAQVPERLAAPLVPRSVRLLAGTVQSEAYVAHGIGAAVAAYNVTGAGVKTCVLSDGVDGRATSETNGDVSPIDVLPGQAGTGSEGLAMLELIHDLAPDAPLGFATGFNGMEGMASNIVALADAGCRVIVDDIFYPLEAPFQDDVIAQAVNTVTARGVVYLSSAANTGSLAAGTSGTWEGDFLAGPFNQGTGTFHDFLPGDPDRLFNRLTPDAAGRGLVLSWPDPIGAPQRDYDLYVTDVNGNVVARSNEDQSVTGNSFEGVIVPSGAFAIAVVLFEGAPSALRIHLSRGELEVGTAGGTFGHNAALSAISVGATPAADPEPGVPGAPTGPVFGPNPGPFTNANLPELFSTDGPRRLYYSPTGTPYTPGDTSAAGGVALHKPDLLAADGTVTSLASPFARFYGTSAAAPHAAAIVALMRQLRPAATVPQLADALRVGSIDLGNPGYDPVSGYGILMALPALQALVNATPGPAVPVPVEPDVVPLVPQRILETRPDVGQVGYTGPKPGAGAVIELQIDGVGSPPVPRDAAAVVLNITGTEVGANGFVTAYPCGASRPTASNLNLTTGDTRANLVVAKIGDGGRVCLFTLNPTHLIADLAGYMPGGSNYEPVVPERLLETRPAGQTGYTGAKPAAGQTVELQVTGVGATAVPADAEAVVLNVTATEATVAGFVTVYPCGIPRPTASNLNLTPGVTAANLVVSKIGAGGKVCLYTQQGGHLLADVAGYHPAGSAFTPVDPVRVLDTRIGLGAAGPAAVGRVVPLTVAGTNGVPADATTVVLNVTATDVAADGFVTVWPCAEPKPTASNVNVPRGDTRPNLVYAKVDGAGQVCLFTLQPMAVIADLVGWYP